MESDFQRSAVHQQLMRDLQNYSFCGLIKLFDQFNASLNDEISRSKLPAVRLGVHLQKSDVVLDVAGFTRTAVEFMAQKGLRKICYLRNYTGDPDHSLDLQGLEQAVRRFSLPPVEICEILSSGLPAEQAAYEKTLQLIDQWQARKGDDGWPDALLVLDDIATRGVVFALIQKGIKVPDRLLLMCAANEGIIHYYGIPVIRYDFSAKTIVKKLLDILRKRMWGETLKGLPVKIAGELKPASAAAANPMGLTRLNFSSRCRSSGRGGRSLSFTNQPISKKSEMIQPMKTEPADETQVFDSQCPGSSAETECQSGVRKRKASMWGGFTLIECVPSQGSKELGV
ncbi:MAG: substrate-binding domain-containing protein [Verrucomicrobiae bacterium]|nr:substrate-binding domain-containing protein [Verrucomicrobiae bacterium]